MRGGKYVPVFNISPIVAQSLHGSPAPFARETHDACWGVGGVVSASGRWVDDTSAACFVRLHDTHCGFSCTFYSFYVRSGTVLMMMVTKVVVPGVVAGLPRRNVNEGRGNGSD
jgi:hypothetical protein